MNRPEQNNIIKGIVKRMGITILCCIPALVLIGFWLQGINEVGLIALFVVFMLVVIAIEEYIHIKHSTKRQLMRKVLKKDEDVFK